MMLHKPAVGNTYNPVLMANQMRLKPVFRKAYIAVKATQSNAALNDQAIAAPIKEYREISSVATTAKIPSSTMCSFAVKSARPMLWILTNGICANPLNNTPMHRICNTNPLPSGFASPNHRASIGSA